MEFHRPKPWHSAREFLKEIAIVVVGVLIAIGGEQLVEALNWRERVDAGRQSLKADLFGIVWNVGEQEAEDTCLRSRLRLIRQAVLADPRVTPGVGDIGNPASRGWYPSSWDSLVAANISAHMDREELVRFADIAVRASISNRRRTSR